MIWLTDSQKRCLANIAQGVYKYRETQRVEAWKQDPSNCLLFNPLCNCVNSAKVGLALLGGPEVLLVSAKREISLKRVDRIENVLPFFILCTKFTVCQNASYTPTKFNQE